MVLMRRRADLVTLIVAPTVWAAHFLVCYVAAAVHCARAAAALAPLGPVRWTIAVATLVALALILAAGAQAWRHWGFGLQDPPHDADTPDDRQHFLGYATLLLAGLSFVSVLFVALPAVMIGDCR